MSGPHFREPFLWGNARKARNCDARLDSPHRGSGGWSDGLGTLLHLGCLAVVGILTIYVFFSVAFDFLVQPKDEIASVTGAREAVGRGIALCRVASPGDPPGVRADKPLAPQPVQPGSSRQPAQPTQPLVLAAALAPRPEPRRSEVDQNLAAKAS